MAAPVLLMVRELTYGGTERQLTELAKALDRSRFEPHVMCFREGPRAEELRAAGVPTVLLPVRSFMKPSALAHARTFRRYLREHRIALVHAFDYPANIFGVPLAKLFGVPALASVRGYRTNYERKYRAMLRVSDLAADGIVVNSEAMRRHAVDDYGLRASKVHLCPNGIDTTMFRPMPRERGGEPVIGTICVLRPEKGVDVLIDAFAQVRRGSLVIVGSGPERERLVRRAAGLGVCFEPATDDVPAWLRRIDVFVLPSRSEAFSNSLMEAMACGCACIASRTGGNPELIDDGKTGLLFKDRDDLAAKLGALLDDAELRARLGAAAAKKLERYSIAASAQCMGEIYGLLLQRR